MHTTGSKLSPWPYIRNNRVRTTVLIISLATFMVMIYTMNYIIAGTDEPFIQNDVAPLERLMITSTELDFNSEDYEDDNEYLKDAWLAIADVCEDIKTDERIADAKPFAWQYVRFRSVIGGSSSYCYLFQSAQDCDDYLRHMGGKLISGRMPEKPGELLMEKKLIDNNKNAGDLLQYMGSQYEVVGIVESDYYLTCGIAQPGENNISELLFLKEGTDLDVEAFFEEHGYTLTYYRDKAKAEKSQKDSMGNLDLVQTIFTGVSGALLLICVSVVLALHIMDRHNEWCLLHSIGFSTKEIYLMALQELLICVLIALVIGSVLSFLGVFGMSKLLYEPIGISLNMWRPAAIPRIVAVFLALMGIAQIPIFSGMRKIQTIDTIES